MHYRREVSFEEDRCRVKNRQAAETLVVLRNLTLGLDELERDRGKTQAASLKTWMKYLTFGTAHGLLGRRGGRNLKEGKITGNPRPDEQARRRNPRGQGASGTPPLFQGRQTRQRHRVITPSPNPDKFA